jgi:hypothetical protein
MKRRRQPFWLLIFSWPLEMVRCASHISSLRSGAAIFRNENANINEALSPCVPHNLGTARSYF